MLCEYYTTQELIDRLNISRTTLWRWQRRLGIESFTNRYDARERIFLSEDCQRLYDALNAKPQPAQAPQGPQA